MNLRKLVQEEVNKELGLVEEDMAKRAERDWKRVAKEPIEVEQIKGTIYAYGSELAMLRLFYYYRHNFSNGTTSFGYSSNLRTFYFGLDI